MEPWHISVLLGAVEGLTEFIPVSSTGHLIIAGHLLGFTGEKAASFDVAIQLGAILAVVVLYWRRFLDLIPFGTNGAATSTLAGWSGIYRMALAALPVLVAGYLGHDWIKTLLFTPTAVAAALAVGGVAILFAERRARAESPRPLDHLSFRQALGIGLFQILSLWPGVSRAAATIAGGMLLGLDRKGAAEFSFLVAVPVMIAASGHDIVRLSHGWSADELTQLILGLSVSFAVALVSVAAFIRALSRWSLVPFAWYRIFAAPLFYFLTRG
jgi:undecaprenyl-diphosphatase